MQESLPKNHPKHDVLVVVHYSHSLFCFESVFIVVKVDKFYNHCHFALKDLLKVRFLVDVDFIVAPFHCWKFSNDA